MPVTIDGWTITNARAAEIQAALQHHTSSDSIPGVPELRQWIQRQIYGLVLKYRESLQPDIDRSDPLE